MRDSVESEASNPDPMAPPTEPTLAMPASGLTTPVIPIRPGSSASDAQTIGGPGLSTAGEPSPSSFLGHYRILEPLGRGGMGVVYKAYHPGLDRMYALKVMQVTPQTPADPIERFLREARAVAKIGKHPNIVQVHDVGQHGTTYYLAMDLIEGQSLDRAIGGKPLANRAAAEIAHRVARALEVAHAAGIVHRDLKPSNILIGRDGLPQVSDFGLARDASVVDKLSTEGQVLGTLQYMSPEQARGDQSRVGPPSDVYGVGATLYEMLTGRAPFSGGNQFETWSKVVSEDPIPASRINPNVHPDLETICMKSLEKEPERRYACAKDLADELDRFLRNEPIRARPTSLVNRAWRKTLKHRAVIVPLAVALLILTSVAIYAGIDRARQRERVQSGLADGRRFQQLQQPREARDAYKKVLALAPGNAEATTGVAWADREVRRMEDGAEDDRLRALAEKTAADEALRKSGLVQNVLARWILLADPLRKMEGEFYDSTVDLASRRAAAAPLWGRVKEFMDETPADPSSQSAMFAMAGWARRLAGHEEEGAAWMDQSRALDPDLPYGALMKALVAFSNYLAQQPLPRVQIASRGVIIGAAPAESDAMRGLRGEIDALLADAEHAKVWGSGIAEDFRRAILAIQALQAGRAEDAEKGLSASLGTAAMQVFRMDVYLARAKARYTLTRFQDSLEDLTRLAEVRPRMAVLHFYLGAVHYALGAERGSRGEDPRAEYGKAITEYTEATLGSPDVDILGHRGNVWENLGDAERDRGVDPRASFKKGIEDFTRVLEQRPDDDDALVDRGTAWARMAREDLRRGGDAAGSIERSRRDLETALRVIPKDSTALVNLGTTLLAQAEAKAASGEDPRESYDLAALRFAESLAGDPSLVEAMNGIGMARCGHARADSLRGVDPRAEMKEAIDRFAEALSRNPSNVNVLLNRANAYTFRAHVDATAGVDPIPSYDLALADLAQVAKINPDSCAAYDLQGSALLGKATAEQAAHKDFRPSCDLAIAAYDESVRRRPEETDSWLNRGMAWSKCAEAEGAAGKDPSDLYAKAVSDFGEALQRNPRSVPAFNSRGIALSAEGTYKNAHGADPKECWEKALEDFRRAAELDASHWMSRANRGLLLEQLGRTEEAVHEYEAALKICPGQAAVTRLLDAARKKLGTGAR